MTAKTFPNVFNVLFLCTGNSARSIMAEAILNHLGGTRFKGFSAGSHPKGAVNPLAFAVLTENGVTTAALSSKSWDVFAGRPLTKEAAPEMDFIITVCDQAAGEVCPVWPGRPFAAHWGLPDPRDMAGFRDAYRTLEARIRYLISLNLDVMEFKELRRHLAWAAQLPQGT